MEDSGEGRGDLYEPLNLSRTVSPTFSATPGEDNDEESTLDPADINVQIDEIGFGKFHVIAATTFILFAMSDGMELVVTNVAWRDLPREEWNMDNSFRAFFVSLSFAGFLFGAFVGGFAGDIYGRRAILFTHGVIFIPASILSGLSQDKYSLMVLRFCVGVSMGLVLPTCVSLMTEFSPSQYRARSVVLIPGIAYCIGQAAVLFVGICLIRGYHEQDCRGSCGWWRGMMVAGVVPDALAILLTYFFLPESPRFLLYQGKLSEVRAVLHQIAAVNGVDFDARSQTSRTASSIGRSTRPVLPGQEQPQELWAAVSKSLNEFASAPTSFEVTVIVSLWCLLGCSVFGQSFLYPILLEGSDPGAAPHIGSVEQFWLLIMVTLIEIPGIPLAIFLMEHPAVGQRLAIAGFALCSLSAAALLCFIIDDGRFWIHTGILAQRFFSIVPYEIMYVYAAETLPTSHRNSGVSMGNAATKGVAMVVPLIMLPLLQYERHLPFVVMGVCAALAAMIALVCAAEPAKALQDVVQVQTPRTRTDQWAKAHGESDLLYPGVQYVSPHGGERETERGQRVLRASARVGRPDAERDPLLESDRAAAGARKQVYGSQGSTVRVVRKPKPEGDAPSDSDGDTPVYLHAVEREDSSSGHGSLGSDDRP